MHDRGLHVVDMDGIGSDVPGIVVGRSIHMARPDAAAGQPPTVGPAKVVAPLGLGRVPLPKGGPAKFTPPDHQRVSEQATLLEVEHQGCRRALSVAALLLQLREQVVVLIPAGVHQLHEAGAPLQHPAGNEAVGGESSLHMHVGAVAVEHALGLR